LLTALEPPPAFRSDSAARVAANDIVDRARRLFIEGRYGHVLRTLDADVPADRSFEATLLRVRALLFLDRPAEAAALLEDQGEAASPDDRASAMILRGVALQRTGRLSDGWGALHRAKTLAVAASPEVAAEAAFSIARAYWREGRLHEAECALDGAFEPGADLLRTRAFELRGLIALRRERHADAVVAFREALRSLERTQFRDEDVRGGILAAFCAVAYDTGDVLLAHELRRIVTETPAEWIAQRSRAAIRFALGMAALGAGDHETAWDDLTAASRSERPIDVLCADVGLADLSRARGDAFCEKRHFRAALETWQSVDFSVADDRELLVLLAFGACAARMGDVATAQACLVRFERLRDERDHGASRADRRVDASRWFASALVAEAEGRPADALAFLEQAAAAWTAIGCLGRAAEIALDRARIENAANAVELTPAEHRVMLAICKGMRAREIADAFGRSENTIKNQTRRLFERMGVRNRAELVAKSIALGMFEATAEMHR
jgi:DNA-binding CsgD family transcriptional regulator/Tfp pilus assembly protein PilF